MEPIAPKLPTAFGSIAALTVASVSLLVQASPVACLMRAVSAFVVFAAFGIVIRYLLADDAGTSRRGIASPDREMSIEDVTPGTSVDDLLAEEL